MTTETTPTPMERVFVADNREFPDPDPSLPIDEVKNLLAGHMPELFNADVKETKKDGKTYIQFIKKVGTLG